LAENVVFNTDQNGLSSLHYAMRTGKISIFKEILSIYERNEKGEFKKLMFSTKDNAGNTPFALAIKENASSESLQSWIMNQFGDDLESKVQLLLSESANGVVHAIEPYRTSSSNSTFNDIIYEYFSKTKVVNKENAVLAGRCMMYLGQHSDQFPALKMIIGLMEDQTVIDKVLRVRNSSNIDILRTVSSFRRTFDWFLDEVVPDDHPCLWSRSEHSGKTALMVQVQNEKLEQAAKLLGKIRNNEKRLQLLNAKTQPGQHRNESLMEWAQRLNIKPIVEWLGEQIADAQ